MNLQAELLEMTMADQEIVMIAVGLSLRSTLIDMFLAKKMRALL